MMTMMCGGFVLPASVIIISYGIIIVQLYDRRNLLQVDTQLSDEEKERIELKPTSKQNKNIVQKAKITKINSNRSFQTSHLSTIIECSLESKRPSIISQISRKMSPDIISKKSKKSTVIVESNSKVTKNLFTLVICFFVTWGPYCLITLIMQFFDNRKDYVNLYVTSIPSVFAKSSVMINPLVYVLSSKKIKMKMKILFKKSLPGIKFYN